MYNKLWTCWSNPLDQLLSGPLLPWTEVSLIVFIAHEELLEHIFGCNFIQKGCSTRSPRLHHSVNQIQQAHRHGWSNRHDFQQVTLCISLCINSQLLLPPCCAFMLIMALVTSFSTHISLHGTEDLLPRLRTFSGTERIWQSELHWRCLDLKPFSIFLLIIRTCKEQKKWLCNLRSEIVQPRDPLSRSDQ